MAELSDLKVIAEWFTGLATDKFVALQPSDRRYTQTDGHEDAFEHLDAHDLDGDTAYAFWTRQGADTAFDPAGTLVGDLPIHWGGEREVVAAHLTGLDKRYALTVPEADDGVFVVRPAATPVASGRPDPTDTARAIATLADLGWGLAAEDLAWARHCLRAGTPPVRVEALRHISSQVSADDLDAFAADWQDTVKGIAKNSIADACGWFLGHLNRTAHPALADVVRGMARHRRGEVRRAVQAQLASMPPTPDRLELVEHGLAKGDPCYYAWVVHSAGARGISQWEAALELDERFPDQQTQMPLVTAICRARGVTDGTADGVLELVPPALDIAADESLPRSLRERALRIAERNFPPGDDREDRARFDALLAAGLTPAELFWG